MAIDKYIPRLEWNEVVVTGTVAGAPTPTITGIASTTNILAGMIATGVGIPANTTVLSKTLSTVTLSQSATVNGTASFTFFQRFDFTYPPTRDTEDVLKSRNHVSTSISGLQQVVTDHVEFVRDLDFGFLTQTERNTLRDTFFRTWSVFGYQFRYFQDKADATFQTVELESYDFTSPRQVKKHPEFLYGLKMKTRRVA